MTRTVIIGSGNVAEAFARSLPALGIEVVQIYARNGQRGAHIAALAGCGYTPHGSEIAAADLYIAAVSDRAIESVLEPLGLPADAVVVHVSGGRPLSAIPAKFPHRGVLYPLQTFTAGREVDFREIPIFIEGCDPATTGFLKKFAGGVSRRVYDADSAQRARIHLAGVFACNFVNAMYAAGGDVASSAGMPFDILRPLIAETARKAVACDDPRSVQTGPAVRRDEVTLERHLGLLHDDGAAELQQIYELISKYIKDGKKL